jgi:peptidoglycan hydrolase-like protein with peptidoglycan-binding domain
MTPGKHLTQFAAFALVMPAAVALSLWILFVPLRIDRAAGAREHSVTDQVTLMQSALVKRGYWVGAAGVDGNFSDDTRAALLAFQDNSGLPVHPKCDLPCRNKLGLPSGPDIVAPTTDGLLSNGPSPSAQQ